MRAVFDTNILIDYLSGAQPAARELALYEEKLISVITYIEVMVGAANREQESVVENFLQIFTLHELSADVASQSIKIRQQHRLKIPDAIVYATAKVQGALLVTRNSKDFKTSWPDIRVPYTL